MPLRPWIRRFTDGASPCGQINTNGRFIDLGEMNIGIACHQAAFMWIYQATHDGRLPAQNQLLEAQTFVNALYLRGDNQRVTEKSPPQNMDVLIFTAPGKVNAEHTCFAYRGGPDGTIAGYNQQGWFNGAQPIANDFTLYPVANIDWARSKPSRRDGESAMVGGTSAKHEKHLWAIREDTALSLMLEMHPD